ncbi:stalk domain-containing protein [Paenibacillus sp. Y412MC10]|uniref:stalk domain-containing protein n=1 Tax=Geobacillus sp. (strain Y412MC10) TaxID=481743 RepID=UPI001642FA1B|nr:stalk domain-containing protein [Paenibacillus sp. Y412MC10]
MKKKIIAVALAGTMLFGGVVSAAGFWGTYKGNDIIRVQNGGSTIKPKDVPAVNLNGRTMIPLSMLSDLGVTYTWDGETRTVDLLTPSTGSSSIGNSESIKNKIKSANLYHDLETLGDIITSIPNMYFTASQYMNSGNTNTPSVLQEANKQLNGAINNYNYIVNNPSPYSDAETLTVLNYYLDAIESFKKMDTALNMYYQTKGSTYSQAYLDNNKAGYESASKGRLLASSRYTYYINDAINTK